MTLKLDHILWAAPDLDAGVRAFEELTGVTPVVGGTHPGFGTRNRLMSLSPEVFIEVISPDPAQSERGRGGRAGAIAAMPGPGLLTFAVQTTDLDATSEAAARAGLSLVSRDKMSRTRPDGVRLDWTVARFGHPDYGDLVPFAIDWQGSPHPAASTPGGCALRQFAALHPDPGPLRALYGALGLDIPVWAAVRPGLIAVLGTPRGEACLLSV